MFGTLAIADAKNVAGVDGTKPGGWVQIGIFIAVICRISAVSALTVKESFKIPTTEFGLK